MRKLLGEQARMLHRGCRILTFEFDFKLLPEYKLVLEYNNEMNSKDVPDKIVMPVGVNIAENIIFFKFDPYMEDRVYELKIWGSDTSALNQQLKEMLNKVCEGVKNDKC